MKIKMFTIPNVITLGNLILGCIAIIFTAVGPLPYAFLAISAAAVLDFLDGFAARTLKQYSEIGKQLDSLADMVSFGVAPAFVIMAMSQDALVAIEGGTRNYWFHWIPFLLAAFSALRLARFNIDETQTDEFRGLPTPACALLVASAGWLWDSGTAIDPWVTLGGMAALCFLLVSPIRMFSLKFKTWGIKENALRYTFLLGAVVLISCLRLPAAIFTVIAAYIAVSTIRWAACAKHRQTTQ